MAGLHARAALDDGQILAVGEAGALRCRLCQAHSPLQPRELHAHPKQLLQPPERLQLNSRRGKAQPALCQRFAGRYRTAGPYVWQVMHMDNTCEVQRETCLQRKTERAHT